MTSRDDGLFICPEGTRQVYDKTFLAVAGECPCGCGRTLFLGSAGRVTCSWSDCPNPAAADEMLHEASKLWRACEALRETL